MKRIVIITILVSFNALLASPKDLTAYTEDVKGPVKKMEVTCNQVGTLRTWTYWYDTAGRLTEFTLYHDNKLEKKYLRTYVNEYFYVDYYYNANGMIEGSCKETHLDSLGHKIYSIIKKDGSSYLYDSTIYNVYGKEIARYVKQNNDLTLQYVCEYDSIGRLIRQFNNWRGSELEWTYEYLPNGDYIEHYSTIRGRHPDKEYIHNENGQLVEIKGKEEHSYFTKFDKYGNWMLWTRNEYLSFGNLKFIYKRRIEYYK